VNAILIQLRQRLGRSDLIVLGIGLLGLIGLVSHVAPLALDNASLERRLVANTQERKTPSGLPSPAVEALQFLQSLPGDQQRTKDIAQLSILARNHGLLVSQMSLEEDGRQMSAALIKTLNGRIALEGSYLSIRKWLNEILATMPNLAISTFRMTRSPTAGDRLQARVEFIYHSQISPTENAADDARPRRLRHLPEEAEPTVDPFGFSATPRPVVRTPPAPDKSPPLPIAYGGSYRSANEDVFLLIEGDNVHRIRVGETLPGGKYRLDSALGDHLILVHLPSAHRYPLPTGNLAP
jgi:hypothetical protein